MRCAPAAGVLAALLAWSAAPGAAGLRLATEPQGLPAPAATAAAEGLGTPPEYHRPPEQTFLTVPEWFLVQSPAEYARWLAAGQRASAFPLFTQVAQFWQGYAAVAGQARRFPFNGGYHLMICVIGASTTLEYTLKGLYEHTIGRLAEATRTTPGPLPEELLAAGYAQRYVDFIRVEPWYRFDFDAELHALWHDVPLAGPDAIRRWERRFLLTTELLVKSGYARLIGHATRSLYDAPRPLTAVVLASPPPRDPDVTVLRTQGRAVLATLPRYEGFTTVSRRLADAGLDFRAVAGNDGEIVVSVLAPDGWQPSAPARLLFDQPVPTQPGRQRSVLAVPVPGLGWLLRDVDRQPALQVEHVYDF